MDLIKLIDQNVECVATPNGKYLKRSEVFEVVEKITSTNSAMAKYLELIEYIAESGPVTGEDAAEWQRLAQSVLRQ